MKRTTRYLTMRDGVRIAVDVWLPDDLKPGAKLPAIVHQTRYFRSVDWQRLLRLLKIDAFLDINATLRRRCLESGYAWVDVDARGSGASSGSRPCPWHPDEVRDGAEIVDWIVSRPWSSGLVGSTGVSYGGTTAEFLATNRHPAVRAVIPKYALFDVYTDVAFPGGLHLDWFTNIWARFNSSLDRNAYHEALGLLLRLNTLALGRLAHEGDHAAAAALMSLLQGRHAAQLVDFVLSFTNKGVRPVGGSGRQELLDAVRGHVENFDVHAAALKIVFRDDAGLSAVEPGADIDFFSPHNYLSDLAASAAAVYSYSGWMDGAYQHGAIKRHINMPAGRGKLIIGPWDHGGRQNISPFDKARTTDFDHDAEQLRFFDFHLKGIDNGVMDEPGVRYFTLGEERWKTSDTWPPPNVKPMPWYFGAGKSLKPQKPGTKGEDRYKVDFSAGTGKRSRWRSLLGLAAPVGYGDRRVADRRLLCYTSAPLTSDMEVTGHPVVHLFVSSTAGDGGFFVYLEEVDQAGRVTYVTEGQLRALHRKISRAKQPYRTLVPYHTFKRRDAKPLVPGKPAELVFDLLPISYLFRRGNCVRVAVAGADCDHFALVPSSPPQLTMSYGGSRPSRIDLPVVRNS